MLARDLGDYRDNLRNTLREFLIFLYGPLAQVVEHLTFNQVVRGSSPRWLTKIRSRQPLIFFMNISCGYGGIGRRARFRFWCLRRAGSSPVIRTTSKKQQLQGKPCICCFFYFFSDKTEQNILCYNEYSDGNEERKMHKFFKIANRILNIVLVCIIACCGNR